MSVTRMSDSSSFVQSTLDADASLFPGDIAPSYAPERAAVVRSTDSHVYEIAKRAFDIVVSAALLVALLPVFLVTALLVKLTSPGPIVFGQDRCGRDGKPFRCYKFRTMVQNAEILRAELLDRNEMSGPVFKIRNDPRITPLGRVLRKTSIDELPQLWNVLRGDMSFVGPRPPLPAEVATYTPRERDRKSVV